MEMLQKAIFLMDHTLLGEEESSNYPSIYEKKTFPAGKLSQNKTKKAFSTQHGKKSDPSA